LGECEEKQTRTIYTEGIYIKRWQARRQQMMKNERADNEGKKTEMLARGGIWNRTPVKKDGKRSPPPPLLH
jgi:hypothetical protein